MGVVDWEIKHLLGASYSGGGVCFTSCGANLVVALHGRVQVIDLRAGRATTLPFEASRSVIALDVRRRFILTVDEVSRVALLSLPHGRVTARLTLKFSTPCVAAALSPCGRFAAFASDKEIQIWAVPSAGIPEYAAFEKISQFKACGAAGKGCLDWSPDSKRLAVGGTNGVCYVFTVRYGQSPRGRIRPTVLYGHRDAVANVSFCGERGLLTLSRDGALFCWRLKYVENEPAKDTSPSGTRNSLNTPEDVEMLDENGLDDSSEGESSSDGDAKDGYRRYTPVLAKLSSRHFVKSGNGKRVRTACVGGALMAVGMSNGVFSIFELPDVMSSGESVDYDRGLFELAENRKLRRSELAKRQKLHPAIDGDDERGDDADSLRPSKVAFTELNTIHTLSAAAGAITSLQFNNSGEWLALASSHSGQILVWEWRAETHILKQQAHVLSATCAAFSPDGRALTTGSRDGRVKLWNVVSGFCAATFADHSAAVTSVAFAANDVIVSSSLDGTARAFDIRRYRNFRIFVGPPPRRQFGTVAVDASGELVAAGCVDTFEIVVWSLRTGSVLEVLAGHKGPVSAIAFRPHRGTLASASWDRTVRMWDMYERKGSCEVLEHSKEALAVCFRPDGKELAVASMSGEISLWDANRCDISGTIDGAREAAAGRLRNSRTVADKKGHFQALSYSADGKFLLAGAASKNVCIYNVKDGTSPSLVDSYAVTKNQNFDGLLDELNSKNLTLGGHGEEVLDDDDETNEAFGEAKIAEGRSLPGADSELKLKRKKLMKAEVKNVHFCPSGRTWCAVTTEGVLVYSEPSLYMGGAADDIAFDPTDLDVSVTPKAAFEAAKNGRMLDALLIALRLNERSVLSKVVETVPFGDIRILVSQLPPLYFTRLVMLTTWRIENGPHLAYDLEWARCILVLHGAVAHNASSDSGAVNSALRGLHRAVSSHSKRLVPLSLRNSDTLTYLLSLHEAQPAAVSNQEA